MTSCAHYDLIQAAAVARQMVAEFGMSTTLGPVAVADGQATFLRQIPFDVLKPMLSVATAARIDDEVRAIFRRNYSRAEQILAVHR